ncbi:MAG: hypothetical protein ACKVQK_18005 [Burkholderiales bacterium]
MSALSHYLEEEGIATVSISLVREHTEAMKPPRALWVPFVLGRPFGVPNDAAFQARVLLAALGLLERSSGPVLADFDEEAPVSAGGDSEQFVCPVSFAAPSSEGNLAGEFQREIAELSTWHEMTKSKRGRTTASLSGLTLSQAAKFVSDLSENDTTTSYRQDLDILPALRLVCHDIRAYYLESVAAQPGAKAAAEAEEWFWLKTAAGKTMFKLRDTCNASRNEALQRFGLRAVPTRFTPA